MELFSRATCKDVGREHLVPSGSVYLQSPPSHCNTTNSYSIVGALEIGGEVRIGNPSCLSRPLIAKGYVGVDQLSPINNFYTM